MQEVPSATSRFSLPEQCECRSLCGLLVKMQEVPIGVTKVFSTWLYRFRPSSYCFRHSFLQCPIHVSNRWAWLCLAAYRFRPRSYCCRSLFVLLSTSVRTISHTRFELLGMALFGCVQVSTPFILLSTSARTSFHTPFGLLGMALYGCVQVSTPFVLLSTSVRTSCHMGTW